MFIGKVIGTVVATQKYSTLEGVKLLVVQSLNDDYTSKGRPLVAVDAIRTSGVGEFVYLVDKKEAGFPFPDPLVPADAAIVGHIDEYHVQDEEKEQKEQDDS